jgi:histidinol-phosphatase (PHP family)
MRYLYPRKEFWEIVREYNCEVIINSDAHYLNQHDDEELRKAYELGNEWGLNIIDSIG